MNIDITTLTKEQLKAITDQLKTVKAEAKTNRDAWKEKVDSMLKPTDDGEFLHTTADIWLELHLARLEDSDPRETHDKENRDRVLKKIQARKQKLKKDGMNVGYKPTPKVIGTKPDDLSVDRLISLLIEKADQLEARHIQTLSILKAAE
jgi:hypothetical protein